MTDHPTDTDIIAAHKWSPLYETCECHKPWDYDVDTIDYQDYAAHVAEALTAARTISTVDELGAPPAGTIILDPKGWVWQRIRNIWVALGRLQAPPQVPMPVRILYRPDSEAPS